VRLRSFDRRPAGGRRLVHDSDGPGMQTRASRVAYRRGRYRSRRTLQRERGAPTPGCPLRWGPQRSAGSGNAG